MKNTAMKLSILGATGSVGREVVAQALSAGHDVTVLVRDPQKLGDLGSRVTVVQGDVTDAGAINRAIQGTDAVINTLGHTKSSPNDVLAVASSNTITAMQKNGVKRLVVLTNTALPNEGDHPTVGQRFQGAMMGMMMGQINKDHAAQAQLVINSGLDWTIVRSAMLADGPHTGKYRVGKLDGDAGSKIARADVADFMLISATTDTYVRSLPVVSQ